MKQFKAPRADKPPLDFELVYERLIDDEWQEQTDKFRARGSCPGNLLVSLTAAMSAGPGIQASELQRMFRQMILPEDKERFFNVINDEETAIPIQTLGEIIEWLASEYSGRPT